MYGGQKSIFCCTWCSRDEHGHCLWHGRDSVFLLLHSFQFFKPHTPFLGCEGASCCFPSLGFHASVLWLGGTIPTQWQWRVLSLYNDLERRHIIATTWRNHKLFLNNLFPYNSNHCFELLLFLLYIIGSFFWRNYWVLLISLLIKNIN